MKHKLLLGTLAFVGACAMAGSALAEMQVVVDKSQQRMHVYRDGELLYQWSVSTGKAGHSTPEGTFGVQSMDPNHHSSIYDGAWMPWSVFFNGDIAIHGTYKSNYKYLGGVASHGCVRLTQENAQVLYNLVLEEGRSNVTIVVKS